MLARHVYIEPKQLSNTGCFRFELYGHKEGDESISGKFQLTSYIINRQGEWQATEQEIRL
jgi:hypothetical protein